MLLTPEVYAVGTIVLMTNHYLYVMLVILLVPVDTLLVVLVQCTSLLYCCSTVLTLVLNKIWICHIIVACLAEINVVDARYGESIGEYQCGSSNTVKPIAKALASINEHVAERVALTHVWTCDSKS